MVPVPPAIEIVDDGETLPSDANKGGYPLSHRFNYPRGLGSHSGPGSGTSFDTRLLHRSYRVDSAPIPRTGAPK